MLDWKKRCRKDQTEVSDRKIWETKCGKYRVSFSHIRYGEGCIPDRFFAEESYVGESDRLCWTVISQHRKKNPAIAACERRAKERKNAAAKLERMGKKSKRRER